MKNSIPYDFVFEALGNTAYRTKPMFGAHAVYVGEKIVLILRQKDNNQEDNGVWLATIPENHSSLLKTFPSMRSIKLFGPGSTGWQILPEDADDFEESVITACILIKKNDPRIGKIPKTKIATVKTRKTHLKSKTNQPQ